MLVRLAQTMGTISASASVTMAMCGRERMRSTGSETRKPSSAASTPATHIVNHGLMPNCMLIKAEPYAPRPKNA
jgi:hypothetical protein